MQIVIIQVPHYLIRWVPGGINGYLAVVIGYVELRFGLTRLFRADVWKRGC